MFVKLRNNTITSKKFIYFLFIIWLFSISITTHIFSQNWIIKNYSEADGFPSSVIFCLTRDANGMLWIGHDKGLSRFDGYNWTHYTEADGLSVPILSICINKETVWVGSTNGLFYSQIKNERNEKLIFKKFEAFNMMTIPQLLSIDDRIYISAYLGNLDLNINGALLYFIKNENNCFTLDSLVFISEYKSYAVGAFNIRNDTLVLANEYYIKALINKNNTNCKVIQCLKFPIELSFETIMSIDFNNNKSYISSNKGLYEVIDNKINRISNQTCHFLFVHKDQLWVAYPAEGIFIYKIPSMQLEKKITIHNGLIHSFIHNSYFFDRDSSLWIPSRCGLSHLLSFKSFIYFDKIPVHSFLDIGNKVLVGNENRLSIIENEKINNIKLPFENVFSHIVSINLFNNYVFFNNGRYLYSFNANKKIDLKHIKTWMLPGRTPFRNSILLNKDEMLIAMGRGLALFNLKNINKPKYFFDSSGRYGTYKGQVGLPSNYVFCLKKTNDGAIIGTRSGIAFFDEKNKTIFIPEIKDSIIKKLSVYDIYINGNDTLLATNKGLFNLYKNTLYKIPLKMLDIEVNCIQIKDSNIYLGTTEGLIILNSEYKIFKIINDFNGLPHRNISNIYFDNSGNLWIGTPSGCLFIDREEITKKLLPDKLYIHKIQEGEKVLFINYLPSVVPSPKQIYLEKTITNLKIFCSSDFILANESIKYIFTFIHNSDTSIYTSNQPYFETPIMTSGNYEVNIKILAQDSSSSNVESLRIIVPTPFYFRWYSIVLYIVILLVLIYFSVHLRTRSIIKRNIMLQNEIELRTKDIRAQMLEIEELSRVRNVFINFFAHDLTNSIANLRRGYDLIIKGTSPDEIIGKHSLKTYINISFSRINDLIKQVLMLGRIEADRIEISKDWFDVHSIIHKLIQNMAFQSNAKNIQIKLDLTEQAEIYNDKNLIESVFENILSNALKYSPHNSEILIKSYHSNDDIVFEFIDQGPGFKPSDFPSMYKLFQKLSAKPTGGESSTGLGLWIAKSLLSLIGGSIEITNIEPHGAKVQIKINKS